MLKRLLLGVLLCAALGVAVELTLGGGEGPDPETATRVQDPSGRRLMLLVLDSLRIEDADAMPSLQTLQRGAYRAEVEPCLERITYMCVKELLTGRSAFSLSGVLQNWGTAATGPGDNLLRDARRAGLTVGMVSAGDLAPFASDIDEEERFKDKYHARETTRALELAQDHDVVVYHYIWFDMASHHYKVGSKKYKNARNDMDSVVAQVVAGLPPDMDLIVAGDHGHSDDGRHVQGQDIPTVVIARSPNITPMQLSGNVAEERVPITAVRYLSAASTGVWSDSFEWNPDWVSWLQPTVSPEARDLVARGTTAQEATVPVAAVIICILMTALAAWIAGPVPAIAAATLGATMGFTFEAWLDVMHFPRGTPRIHEVFWAVPAALAVLGAAWGAVKQRSLRGAADGLWGGAALAAAVSLIALYPVLHHYGVMKNSLWIGIPILAAAAWGLSLQRPGAWRAVAGLVIAGLSIWTWVELQDFRVFNLEIVKYKGIGWANRSPTLTAGLSATLAFALHAIANMKDAPKLRFGLAGLAAIGAAGWPVLPDLAYAVPIAALLVAAFWKGPNRTRALTLAAAWSAPYLYGGGREFGVLATVATAAGGLWMLAQLPEGRPRRWATGTLLILTGYLGMAWTMGLSVAGIDFTFMVKWLPGRWHERLWWLIFIGTTLKVLLPVVLLAELARALLGSAAKELVEFAAGLAWLRTMTVLCFATAWMVHSGQDAAGLRLAAALQDGFFWTLIGWVLLSCWRRGLPAPAR